MIYEKLPWKGTAIEVAAMGVAVTFLRLQFYTEMSDWGLTY
jgi:hypothetical protein